MKTVISLIFSLTFFTGCIGSSPEEGQSQNGPQGQNISELTRSHLARMQNPEVPNARLRQLTDGNTRFALSFYKELLKASDSAANLFISPFSISLALAMTYGGAREQTAEEMAKALQFYLPHEQLHSAFNKVDLALESRNSSNVQWSMANSAWGQADYTFLPSYLDLLAVNYGAGMYRTDFGGGPEPSRLKINAWVAGKTKDKIQDLLPFGAIDSYTRLVLTNAVYFKADWASKFKAENTEDTVFHTLSGKQVRSPMMRQSAELPYARTGQCQVVELPYHGEALSMIVLLPAQGSLSEFEQSLGQEQINAWIAAMKSQEVILSMPRFKYSTPSLRLKRVFRNLGMRAAFEDTADFSGINGKKELLIDEIYHKGFIAVDEEGSEAAAATAVIINKRGGIRERMNVDRPFVFLIQDRETKTILFMGRITDPTNEGA